MFFFFGGSEARTLMSVFKPSPVTLETLNIGTTLSVLIAHMAVTTSLSSFTSKASLLMPGSLKILFISFMTSSVLAVVYRP